MQQLPVMRLKAGEERRLRAGHLWIFSNEVDTGRTPLRGIAPGEQVVVEDGRGRPLGCAYINPNSLICGRLISRDARVRLDRSTLVHRLQVALSMRTRLFEAPWYRLVHGEADGLPGLVVDRFGEVCVVQPNTAGMEQVLEEIAEALERVVAPRHILIRADSPVREREGLAARVAWYGEPGPESLEVREGGLRFEVPALSGQKTGWYYDQRNNRRRLAAYAADARVLDAFAYTGGFAIAAAAAGAREVVAVERSAEACERIAANAERNGVAERVSVVEGEVNDYLAAARQEGERYDVAVVDPPAFIKRRRDRKAGERGYRHVNEAALRLLGRDGVLLSCSCSAHLSEERLSGIVLAAARHLDRSVRTLERGGTGADHPIHPAIPETDYLKALLMRAVIASSLP
ncbi:MAG: class I SAM-dependent rRNA methyltransferase [Halorhodospira sp.]